jgi:hypothetical protein
MTGHQILCDKCGEEDFKYDDYWEEFSCWHCGWVVNDNEKISALNKKRDDELKRKLDILKEPKAVEVKRDGRFIAFDDGVVKDNKTALLWYVGPDRITSWYDAKKWVENLTVAGGGWRMPRIEELQTLYVEETRNHITPLLKTTGNRAWSCQQYGWTLENIKKGSVPKLKEYRFYEFHFPNKERWVSPDEVHDFRAFAVRDIGPSPRYR